MYLECLLEEPSAEAALLELLPKIVPGVPFTLHAHQGKQDLLKGAPSPACKLAQRLRAYSRWIPNDYVICVLVDEDRQDCLALKKILTDTARSSGVDALCRIAVEELEAWFLGDPTAVRAAFPGVGNYESRAAFRDPDAIAGGTWEVFERLLQTGGHHLGGLRKVEAARSVARYMDPERNSSKSFQVFRDGLRDRH